MTKKGYLPMDSREGASAGGEENLIDFMARFTESEQFARVFAEGMSLVEETADYLDGPGREEARGLPRPAALAYATQSMRLTTRLMQMASWLLLQRAVSCGEISPEAAQEEGGRISLEEAFVPEMADVDGLPEGLRMLMERSRRLHERIVKLDAMIGERKAPEEAANPVAGHMDMLQQAFATPRRG